MPRVWPKRHITEFPTVIQQFFFFLVLKEVLVCEQRGPVCVTSVSGEEARQTDGQIAKYDVI